MVSMVTIGAELEAGADALAHAGVPEPRREAFLLWASVAQLPPGRVWLVQEEEASSQQVARFTALVRRRAAGEPRPYVVGSAGFRRLDLAVDRRVLIPRPETEGLVELVLQWGVERFGVTDRSWGLAVDVGTGSGCVALSLAVEGRFRRVIGTDVSSDALTVAGDNLRAVRPATPVEWRHGSLLEPVAAERAAVIVSNPPYLTETEFAALDPAVRQYEPRVALASGTSGLEHTRALLASAASVLQPGGLLVIELDSTRALQTRALAERCGWRHLRVERDLFGAPRYLVATKERE